MLFRIGEGLGEAFYMLGVQDNGVSIGLNHEEMLETLHTLEKIAEIVSAKVELVELL
eukprot:NODE_6841_length_486_cov_48.906178_g6047_i0.p3 GENE.NODE_6841_length_486_cov_48.906178_g6047_i0~~NODE_6841_length_486_cov_48.906178_g6047_i0.p3  ORF type:complete len:57 (-),score=14.45 NODE_6841_length_486_cov_48.906178_g6047_i0:104-274(-)